MILLKKYIYIYIVDVFVKILGLKRKCGLPMIFREISTCEKCEMFQNCESSDKRFLKFCRSSACCGLIIIADLKK